MIFVSYSHHDKTWLQRFMTMFSPQRRYGKIVPWCDEEIKANDDWMREIDKAMDKATMAVLLVSAHFLASNFIMDVELPYLLRARRDRGLKIFWVALTPCDYQQTPLEHIQAVVDAGRPLNEMDEVGYQRALLKICSEINAVLKEAEKPTINSKLNGTLVGHMERGLAVLGKPAVRETEILVFSPDKKWYTQAKVKAGSTKSDCWFGVAGTKPGTSFKIVAITRKYGEPLTGGTGHKDVPLHRSRSSEVTVKRK